jgi:hypothetical protein
MTATAATATTEVTTTAATTTAAMFGDTNYIPCVYMWTKIYACQSAATTTATTITATRKIMT